MVGESAALLMFIEAMFKTMILEVRTFKLTTVPTYLRAVNDHRGEALAGLLG
jgi:hypothetical protein